MQESVAFQQTDRQTKLRQSNVELLRIISMVMIVAHHFSVHGGFEFSTDSITFNRLWVQLLQLGGKIGVDVFVLISGYFLINSTASRTAKAVKLWLQIFIYSVLIFVMFTVLKIEPFGIKALIKHCFPIIFSQWWFASTYFILYIISPYVNQFLNSLDKEKYKRFLVLLTIMWCIVPTFTGQNLKSNELLWFIYLYALAGYIRLYISFDSIRGSTYIFFSVACFILTFLSAVVFDILGTKVAVFGNHATFFYDMQRLPILVISVLLLIGFSRIDIENNPIINIISSATFGVYLIHDSDYVRPFLWKKVFVNAYFSESILLVPYSILVIFIVYIVCSMIELARINLLEKYYTPAINVIANIIDKYKEKLLSNKILDKL